MTEKAQKGTTKAGSGNTNSLPVIDNIDKEYRSMFFTLNNYDDNDIKAIKAYFQGRKNILYVFQEETGENGTPHLQGCFKSKSSIKFSTLKNLNNRIHWERCRSWIQAVDYCSKEDTRSGEIYTNMSIKATIKDPLKDVELYKWQKNIIKLLDKDPDNRTIHWFYDKDGCKGKTTLAKHLCLKHPNNILYTGGKANDIKYAVSEFTSNHENNLKMVIFDFARSQEQYVSYQAIEEVKNGILFNNKYEAKMVVFNNPHVVVFSNFEPDYEALSSDRIKCHKL